MAEGNFRTGRQRDPFKAPNSGKLKARRAQRRTEAEARQRIRDARTMEDHLAELEIRPGSSERERARLAADGSAAKLPKRRKRHQKGEA